LMLHKGKAVLGMGRWYVNFFREILDNHYDHIMYNMHSIFQLYYIWNIITKYLTNTQNKFIIRI
jgi:hypothetical protein